MKTTTMPLNADLMSSLRAAASEVADTYQIDIGCEPEKVIEAINTHIRELQKTPTADRDPWVDVSIPFGSLWGEQLIRDLGWQWVEAVFDDDVTNKAVGVASPDRSLIIYPMHFVFGCIENNAIVTILLAYNAIKSGDRIPDIPPDSHVNVMERVHHIVPPD
ncbi:MAG: hypothetical protein H6822_27335 [Planctomycetaceae bacterium]|nr:hypothetical protein [Planctomycetales bacterium]MCB9925893.1 hypothetical protein [Planctomycetaceae bacterium]